MQKLAMRTARQAPAPTPFGLLSERLNELYFALLRIHWNRGYKVCCLPDICAIVVFSLEPLRK